MGGKYNGFGGHWERGGGSMGHTMGTWGTEAAYKGNNWGGGRGGNTFTCKAAKEVKEKGEMGDTHAHTHTLGVGTPAVATTPCILFLNTIPMHPMITQSPCNS